MLNNALAWGRLAACVIGLLTLVISAPAHAQGMNEDFETATTVGSSPILTGSGHAEVDGYDTGLEGEWAFAGTGGDGAITLSQAAAVAGAGVDGSQAALLYVGNVSFTTGWWYAGLFWPNLLLPKIDPAETRLLADVKGNVAGGRYQLRLEGNRYINYGLDEDFESITQPVTLTFFDSSNVPAGGEGTGYTDSWSDELQGEEAFAGCAAPCTVGASGGAAARALTSGGMPGKAGEIVVTDVQTDATSRWWAGLTWPNQILPSTDTSTIELRAKIKGTANGGTLGNYMLRLEDDSMDWLAFPMTADGGWQDVGGYLSTAEQGGEGDGVFDIYSSSFKVVVVFNNDTKNNWGTGGRLTVDQLFLTGGTTRITTGAITFNGTADGSNYQTIGGLLSEGVSTFPNLNESFDDVLGTGGGQFFDAASNCDGWTASWDDGIEGEEAFAGCWGSVVVKTGAFARGDPTGGDDGLGVGELEVSGVNVTGCPTSGGWWAGLSWPNQVLPISGPEDLANVVLRARVWGPPGGPGGNHAYNLRIEDTEQDHLRFAQTANGTFQEVGGRLLTAAQGGEAIEGCFNPNVCDPNNPDFNWDHGPFTIVVSFGDVGGGECSSWGSDGHLVVDDLFLSPPTLEDAAESFSVVVAFAEETTSWPAIGAKTLHVDNVGFVNAVVPAVTTWGMVAMALLLAAAGTIVVRRVRTAPVRC